MKFVVGLAALLLVGCGTPGYWMRPNGVSEAQFYQDLGQCQQRAVNMYPNPAPTYVAPSVQTNCFAYGSQINCTSTPDVVAQGNAGFQDTIAKLGNDENRQSAISTCLRGKGYAYTTGAGSGGASPSGKAPYGTLQPFNGVELMGYCNEDADCAPGLRCSVNKCWH